MRVALIAPPFIAVPPKKYGGTELFVAELARGLQLREIDVTVYANGESTIDVPVRWLYPQGEWPLQGDVEATLKGLNHFAWAVKEAAQDADLMHVNSAPGLSFARFTDVPMVYTVHHTYDAALAEFYQAYPAVSYVTISSFQGEKLCLPRMRTIHHGIDPSLYAVQEKKQEYLSFLGRIAPAKGTHLAIEIAKKAGIPLKIAGEVQPIYRNYWETMVKPQVDGKFVEYVGEVGMDEKIELLGNSLAMVFPVQWDEPFGLVMIEAMACGTPVLATPRGSVREVVKEGVSGHVRESASELAQCARDLKVPARTVRDYMEELFSVERMTRDYINLYTEILRNGVAETEQIPGMSAKLIIAHSELVEIIAPYPEPRLVYQNAEPRKVNNLTLIDGKTFLSTTVAGDIMPPGAPDVGFFHDDTRFLSRLELRVDGYRTVVLSSSTEQTFASQIELTTGKSTMRETYEIPENTVHIRREQLLSSGILYDNFSFENFNFQELELVIELAYEADFIDVFQVRGVARHKPGHYYQPVVRRDSIIFHYCGLDRIARETIIHLSPEPELVDGTTARWKLRLPPFKCFQLHTTIVPQVEGKRSRAGRPDFAQQLRVRREALAEWASHSSSFSSSNGIFNAMVGTSKGDFHALQIPETNERVIAAGIPWFATMFGRDSIIAAYQSLMLNPRLAAETLRVLAMHQGKEKNDWRDEEPGKILHEYREGEMTRAGEMPFGPYYGSVDATPLWLILLSETFNWTADEQLVKDMLPHAYRALEWIDSFGDLDGDGFVEYLRRSPKGLVNQGWKDSWDAIMHRDGEVAKAPIALCEVQGYVYEAKYRMASLMRSFGDTRTADKLKKESAEMAKRFEKAFWMPKLGFYAMALDRDKRQTQVISSNPGQLLFTRMLPQERAKTVMQRFMRNDMFSGWGWRTISREERIFNPLSYHRGSIWPHDNSLIAHGMALYEFREPANRLFTALFQAALKFRDYRLPELFCGIERREHDDPVQYPVSCSPQAWASGAVFLLLMSVLGIRPSAHRRELNVVNPSLPDFLDHLSIRNMRVGGSRVGLDFTRRGDRTFCNVVDIEGDKLLVNVAFKKR